MFSPRGAGRGSISASGPSECSCFQLWRGSTILEKGNLPGRAFTVAAYGAESELGLFSGLGEARGTGFGTGVCVGIP